MTAATLEGDRAERVEPTGGEEVLLLRGTDLEVTDQLLAPLWRPWPWFKYALGATGMGSLALFAALTYTVTTGIGLWGNNIPVAWAFAIINFVWWIGIGHAGHFHLRHLAPARGVLAHLDQPLRRGDDALRRGAGGSLSHLPSGQAMVRLLARSVPLGDGRVAQLQSRRSRGTWSR